MSNFNVPIIPDAINWNEIAQWKAMLSQALADLRVSIPAIVQSFDPVAQTVVVEIAVREVVKTQNGPQSVAIAPIGDVPVILPSAGGYSLTLPLQAGDEGLLVFCDMCIDLWWSRGGIQDQFERRRHDLSDCGFFPGGKSQARVISNYSGTSAQLRSDDGNTIVDVAETGITLTADKVQINTTGDVDLTASGNVNISATSGTKIDGKTFLTHEHSGVSTGAGVTGPVV